ncbi:MAG TPA: hypothetical protein VF887_05995 [Gemmatimonadaceae bacterium]
MKTYLKKYCNFCGQPMQPEAKECAQCGWDVSRNAPPSTDAGDTKARMGVAAGLVVAYGVLWFMIQGTPLPARAESPRVQPYASTPEFAAEPVTAPPIQIGALPSAAPPTPGAGTKRSALVSTKVADTKGTTIQPRDALQYVFGVPDTDQKCRLVGSTKGIGGFGGNIEVFLLTDDEYVFWNANPAAIAQSSWGTFRGSENTLDYELPGPGTYHFIVSNEMASTPKTMAVKAQLKCAS